jgi:iron complex transport system substrate-binding protein
VSELIEIAGGTDIFSELREFPDAKRRIVSSEEVIKRNPDIIIGSWCGKQFKKEVVLKRKGWNEISAVKNNELHEVKSSIILQPGPASLTEGLDALYSIIHRKAI